jgi:transcriptional regulator with XRE-family HTH domain
MGTRLANRLRHLRTERQLTQAKLAAISGVPIHTIVRLDANSAARPALDVAIKLASALSVPIEALLPEDDRARAVALSA